MESVAYFNQILLFKEYIKTFSWCYHMVIVITSTWPQVSPLKGRRCINYLEQNIWTIFFHSQFNSFILHAVFVDCHTNTHFNNLIRSIDFWTASEMQLLFASFANKVVNINNVNNCNNSNNNNNTTTALAQLSLYHESSKWAAE